MEMNKIHKESAELRQKYYDFVDDYDYSHGGLYDIYTNYSDSYDENGHYEHVFKMDVNSLNLFYENAKSKYMEETSGIPDSTGANLIQSFLPTGIDAAITKFAPKLNPAVGIASFVIDGAKYMYNELMITEKESFMNSSAYAEYVTNKYVSGDLDFYVYILDGG